MLLQGSFKIRSQVRLRCIEIFEQALWQNVGVLAEHILLWWSDNGLGKKNQLLSQKFCSWLKQYHTKGKIRTLNIQFFFSVKSFCTFLMPIVHSINITGNVHILIQPTIQSLIDCLCCYITSTSWDELFSQALISANYQNSRHELQDIGLV